MNEQESITKDLLHDWVDRETRQLDLVASWEELLNTYDVLRFIDPISDTVRLEEFKWIIREMNKFLSRMRSKLLSARGFDSMRIILLHSLNPTGKVTIDGRRALAYQKLRQTWILRSINQLSMLEQEQTQPMNEEEIDG